MSGPRKSAFIVGRGPSQVSTRACERVPLAMRCAFPPLESRTRDADGTRGPVPRHALRLSTPVGQARQILTSPVPRHIGSGRGRLPNGERRVCVDFVCQVFREQTRLQLHRSAETEFILEHGMRERLIFSRLVSGVKLLPRI